MELSTSDIAAQRFRECLDKHEGIIWKVIYAFSHERREHNELFQDILLEIWRSLPGYRGDSKLSTWMYSVGFRCAMNKHRRTRRKVSREVSLESFSAEDAGIHTAHSTVKQTVEQENIEFLYEAIRKLKEVDRSLVLMHLDGLSYAEIGDTLSLSESNVGARLTRVRRKLADLLKEREL